MVETARISEESEYPDVTGVPSSQLQALYEQHLDCEPMMFAERVGIEYNYLKRLVIQPTVPVVRTKYADMILNALGLNMGILERDGLITIVPLNASRKAAIRVVDEEIATAEYLDLPAPTEVEIQERITSLMNAYGDNCSLSAYQLERRKAEAERAAKNRAKKKGGL